MIDIPNLLLAASSHLGPEDDSPASAAAVALGADLSWEWGENWASILRNDTLLARVYVRAPLAMCIEAAREELQRAMGQATQLIVVTNMDAVELCARPDALEVMFGNNFTNIEERGSDPLRLGGFAANDLWFHTVTAVVP